MTKHEQIRGHLDAISELLKPEPERQASLVTRLVNICNQLGRENATLRNDLTDMTLNYNQAKKHARQLSRYETYSRLEAAEKYAERLEADLKRKNEDLDAAFRNNDTLRSLLARKEVLLEEADARIVVLKRKLDLNEKYLEMLKRDRSSLR